MKYIFVFACLVNIVFSEDCTVTQDVEIVKDAAVLDSAQLGFDYNNYPPDGTINNLTEARDWADTEHTCTPLNYYSFYGNTQDGARCGLSISPKYIYDGYPGSIYAKEECVCPTNQYRLNVKDITTRAACKLAAKYAWDVASGGTKLYLKTSGYADFSLSFEECKIYGRGMVKNVSWSNANGCITGGDDGAVYYNTNPGGLTGLNGNAACGTGGWNCIEKSPTPRYTTGSGQSISEEECLNNITVVDSTSITSSYDMGSQSSRAGGCLTKGNQVMWNEGSGSCGYDGYQCVKRATENVGVFGNRAFGLGQYNPNLPANDFAFYYDSSRSTEVGGSDQSGPAYGCFLYNRDKERDNHRIIWADGSFSNKMLSKSPRVVVYNGKYDLDSNKPKITECKTCSSVPEGHVRTAKCGDALSGNFLRDTRVKSCTPGKDFSANVNDTTCTRCTSIPWGTPNDFVASPCTVSSDTVFTTCNGTINTNPAISVVTSYEECKNISILSRQTAHATRVETAPGFFPYGTWNGWKIGLYLFGGESPALPLTRFDDGLYSYGSTASGSCKLYYNDANVMSHRIVWDGSNMFPSKTQAAVISKTEGKYVLADYYRKCVPICGPGYGGNRCSLCAINEYNAVESSIGTACNKKKCPVGKGSPKLTNYNASQVDSETEDCVDCPAGEFSPNDDDGQCGICDDGQCGICASIKAGHELVSICTAVADTVTRPCDANSYQPEEKAWNVNVSCIPFPAITPDSGKYVKHSLKITGITVAQAEQDKEKIRRGIASALGKAMGDIKDLTIAVAVARRRRLLEQPVILVEYNIVVENQQEADTLLQNLESTNFQSSLQGELGSNVGVESNNPVYSFTACKTKGYDNYVDSSTAVQDKELCACDDGKVYALFEFIGCITWLWFVCIIVGVVLVLVCIIMFIYSCAKNNRGSAGAPDSAPYDTTYRPRRPRYQFK